MKKTKRGGIVRKTGKIIVYAAQTTVAAITLTLPIVKAAKMKTVDFLNERSKKMTLQEAIKESHECAKAKGFHSPSPSIPAMLAMISGELSEALEADRVDRYFKKKKWSREPVLISDLPNWADFKNLYDLWVKDTFEAELADACIRIFDLAGLLGLEIWMPPTHLREPDLPGNIMEAMSQIGFAYAELYSITPVIVSNLSNTLGIIFAIAKKLDVDLWAYIGAAMRYNRLREAKHGKKY